MSSFRRPSVRRKACFFGSNFKQLHRSILIIDPKGEIAAITARSRTEADRVVFLNPFKILQKKGTVR